MSVHWNKDHNDSAMWKVTDAQGNVLHGYHPRHKTIAVLDNLFSGEAFAIAARYRKLGYKAVRM